MAKLTMVIYFSTVCLVIFFQLGFCAKKNNTTISGQCSKTSYGEVDELIARMTEMSDSNRFPETIDQLMTRCE